MMKNDESLGEFFFLLLVFLLFFLRKINIKLMNEYNF